ncbi:retropepsin-like aspartic protease [Flavobacterium sp.]|uniref:retropepsin-like aspartic protease n=1 Tax=Flavobacterium sp. TaxID=239 RepID=UPI0025FCE79D|nr:retropepsin-like aspartic protease [Flavobacterium sp.]
MEDLLVILKKHHYKKIKFKVSKTKHLLIKARINGVLGNFILDTGASNSCVDFDGITYFNLTAGQSKTKAAGAGGTGMFTQLAKNNLLGIGRWKTDEFHLIIFDLKHVNDALQHYKAKPVHGIMGADILLEGKAIIDYSNHCLYLR